MDRQTDKQSEKKTDRLIGGQTARVQIDRHICRQIDRQI